jgi:hypothetical protein
MKKIIVSFILCMTAVNVMAADERIASKVVKKYSEAVACQISDRQTDKNQYKAVTINSGDSEIGGMGGIFVVYWSGDIGCMGGNGTVVPNFTVVEQRGFSSVDPVVVTEYNFPDLNLVELTSLTGKDGILVIKGVIYGSEDHQHQPKKQVSYKLKFVDGKFIKQ